MAGLDFENSKQAVAPSEARWGVRDVGVLPTKHVFHNDRAWVIEVGGEPGTRDAIDDRRVSGLCESTSMVALETMKEKRAQEEHDRRQEPVIGVRSSSTGSGTRGTEIRALDHPRAASPIEY